MKGKKKQFLVLGLGRFGSAVARSLCEMGHEVLAVDSDAEAVQAISPHVTQAVQADATDDEVFSSLDAGSYDAAIVSIGSNVRDSILISVLCKEAGVPLVVAKASDDLHAKVLSKVGVDRVVFPERDMGQRAARALVMPQMLDLMKINLERLREFADNFSRTAALDDVDVKVISFKLNPRGISLCVADVPANS